MLWHEWNFWSRYKQMNAAVRHLRGGNSCEFVSYLIARSRAVFPRKFRKISWVYQRFTATSSVLIIIKSFQLPSHPAPGSGLESDWISCFSPTSTPWGRWISDVKSYDSHTAVVHHYTRHVRQIEKLFPGKPWVSAVTQYRRTSPRAFPIRKKPNSFLFEKSSFMCGLKDERREGEEAKKNFSSFNNRKNFEQSRKIEYD